MQDDDMVDDEEMVDYDEEIKKVKNKLEKNPHNEKLLEALFDLLEKNGDFEDLEDMRNKVREKMPLPLSSYLRWIENKENENDTEETKRVVKLALADHQSTNLWFHLISAHDKDDPNTRRKIYEEALSAVGYWLDIADGFWECYLAFEKGIGSDIERVNSLYAQAMSIPYVSLGDLWSDYTEFCDQRAMKPAANIEQIFKKTQEVLKTILPHEKAFKEDPSGYGETYLDAITSGSGNPSHIQAIYERILESNPADDSWWSHYCNWCENKLKVPSVALSVYKRAVRHCSSNPYLWQGLLTSAERAREDPALISSYWESAKETISDAQSGLFLYRTYIYILRRRATATDKNYASVEKLFEEGRRVLADYFGPDWDADGIYRKNYAYFLASTTQNMIEARNLWHDILSSGGGKLADKWLDAVRLERQFGDVQSARKLLYKAINSVADNPIAIYDYFIQFEREEGTLEELDTALEKVNTQERHRSSRPQKQKKEEKKKEVREKPVMKKRAGGESGGPPAKIAIPKPKVVDTVVKVSNPPKKEHPSTPPVIKDKDGFTMPFPVTGPRKSRTPEPVPPKKSSEKAPEPETSKKPAVPEHDGKWTVFCSNIDFKVTAEDIKAVLEGVRDVRLAVRPGQKQHKGFAYVDLDSERHWREALNKDRELTLGQRKMFISLNDPGNRPSFKYNTGQEDSKIFIRNVHFDCTEQELKDFFGQFGIVTSVRIVTHKSGKPKGVAYVDYVNAEAANKAVRAQDLSLHDRKLTVAISNPPARDTTSSPLSSATNQPDGSETARRSHLQIVPRSVATKTVSANGSTGKSLSNDEFRKKFL